MLLDSLKSMLGYSVTSENEKIGTVHNFYFEDKRWKLRYIVIATTGFLNKQLIMVPARAIRKINNTEKSLDVLINRYQLSKTAGVHYDRPVSKQVVKALMKTDNFIAYLSTNNELLPNWLIKILKKIDLASIPLEDQLTIPNPYLRSVREVLGYDLIYNKKSHGKVSDMLIHPEHLKIYGLVNQEKPLFESNRTQLLSTQAVEDISCENHSISLVLPPAEKLSRIALQIA